LQYSLSSDISSNVSASKSGGDPKYNKKLLGIDTVSFEIY